jgi:hypothetical protein
MIGMDIDGVFVHMHADDAIKGATCIEEREECWQ